VLEYLIALHRALVFNARGSFDALLFQIVVRVFRLPLIFYEFGPQVVGQKQALCLDAELLEFFDSLLDFENCGALLDPRQAETLLNIDEHDLQIEALLVHRSWATLHLHDDLHHVS